MKNVLSILMLSTLFLVGTLAFAKNYVVPAYSDDVVVDSTAANELFDSVDSALNTGADKVKKIGTSVCIIVASVCLVLVMLTRDSKKASTYIGMIITALIALLALFVVNSQWATNFISQIASKYFK